MALTDTQVKNAKPTGQNKTGDKLSDEKGLYLHITPAGGKLWRLAYRYQGKQKTLYIGTYPETSLSRARRRRDEARLLLDDGIDPAAAKAQDKTTRRLSASDTFSALADEWLDKQCSSLAATTRKKKKDIIDKNLTPWLGQRSIGDITTPEVLAVIRRMESRGANELARRGAQICAAVFRYAVQTGRADRNPASELRGALAMVTVNHHAAITDPVKLGGLLRSIDAFHGSFLTCCALKLAPMLFVRPGELRHAEWGEVDMGAALWIIPAGKMKMRREHVVPLPRQAVEILKELQPFTGHGKYLFPALTTSARPMSENTINAAFRRMGFAGSEVTGHGLRATARTLLDEVLGERVDLIEHQLAHEVKDANGRAYNRTTHLPARKAMMQTWADYLDKLKAGADVIQLPTAA